MRKLLSYAALVSLVLWTLACSSTQNAPARPEAQQREQPAEADEPISRPIVIQRVEPDASKLSHIQRKASVVILEVLVATDGSVSTVRVMKSPHPDIGAAAAKAVQQWRFAPATKKGQPVSAYYVVTVNIAAN